ncbi:hypothetical protein ACFL3D_05700 [Candidatus Omnitrophota bacterium]
MKVFISISIIFLLVLQGMLCAYANVKRSEIRYDDRGNRDPFLPLIGKDVELTKVAYLKSVDDLMIEGILVDPNKGSVVIANGQVLREGNYIGGFRVDAITPNNVVFSREGKTYTVVYGGTEDGSATDSYKSMFTDVDETEF